jgi:hypothetical protein
MKKITLLVAVLSLAMASCRKDRTCTCTDTSDEPGYSSSTYVRTYGSSKKKDVKDQCVSYSYKETTAGADPYTYTTTCELK